MVQQPVAPVSSLVPFTPLRTRWFAKTWKGTLTRVQVLARNARG